MSTRVDRVAEEVRAAISSAILTEVHDPRLGLVNVTAVQLTRDLSYARVYWNLVAAEPDADDIAKTTRALSKAKGFLRTHVGKTVRLRIVPDLEFRYDVAIERGRTLDALIESLDIPDAEE